MKQITKHPKDQFALRYGEGIDIDFWSNSAGFDMDRRDIMRLIYVAPKMFELIKDLSILSEGDSNNLPIFVKRCNNLVQQVSR